MVAQLGRLTSLNCTFTGWLVKIEAGEGVQAELDGLLSEEEYKAHCESADAH